MTLIRVRRNRPVGLSLREAFLWQMHPMPLDNSLWLWPGCADEDDYGMLRFKGVNTRAHIISYELFVGPVPSGKCVCHLNDTPRDCNPKNLFVATDLDNKLDKMEKGRGSGWKWGEDGKRRMQERSKLTIPPFPDHCYKLVESRSFNGNINRVHLDDRKYII